MAFVGEKTTGGGESDVLFADNAGCSGLLVSLRYHKLPRMREKARPRRRRCQPWFAYFWDRSYVKMAGPARMCVVFRLTVPAAEEDGARCSAGRRAASSMPAATGDGLCLRAPDCP